MEILERDGKYYLQLSNGELELTEEQVKARLQRGAVIRNNLQSWIDNFSYRHWLVKSVSANADAFIKSESFFNDIIRELEQMYHAAHNKQETAEKMLEFCWGHVQKLRKEKDSVHDDKDKIFNDYHTLSWLRIISYLQSLTHIYTPLF